MRGFTCCRPSVSKASMKLRSATTASTRTCTCTTTQSFRTCSTDAACNSTNTAHNCSRHQQSVQQQLCLVKTSSESVSRHGRLCNNVCLTEKVKCTDKLVDLQPGKPGDAVTCSLCSHPDACIADKTNEAIQALHKPTRVILELWHMSVVSQGVRMYIWNGANTLEDP